MSTSRKSKDPKYSYVPIITGDSVRILNTKARRYVELFAEIYRDQHGADPTQKHVDMAGWILQGELEDEFIGYAVEHNGRSPSNRIQAGKTTDIAVKFAIEYLRKNDAEDVMKEFDEYLEENESVYEQLNGRWN